jgi:hypothetical protein
LEAFEREVRADMTLEECWDVLCRTSPQFGFSGVVFHLDDVIHRWGTNTGWQARIEFPERGYISLWRESGAKSEGAAAVLFVDCVARSFNEKLSNLEAVHQQ